MAPIMLNTVMRNAVRRYEARNSVHYADVGEHLTSWRRNEHQKRRIYDEAEEAASANKLQQMVDDWDIVIALALIEQETQRAMSFLGEPSSNQFTGVVRASVEICAKRLGMKEVGPDEGTLSQCFLLDMLKRAAQA